MSREFDKVENYFIQLMQTVNTSFTAGELQEVKQYLEVGEYGLAFETFSDIVIEEEKSISDISQHIVKKISEKLSVKNRLGLIDSADS